MDRNTRKTAFCFLFLICLVASDIEECSREYSETRGGPFAFSGADEEIKAPWLAAMGIPRPNRLFTVICSGSILTRRLILTAAHCFLSEKYKPTHVRVGANNIESIFAEQRKILDVKKHPDYDSDNKAFYFDIAIITVDEGFKFSSRISPICLPDTSSIHPGNGISISAQGWGQTDRDEDNTL